MIRAPVMRLRKSIAPPWPELSASIHMLISSSKSRRTPPAEIRKPFMRESRMKGFLISAGGVLLLLLLLISMWMDADNSGQGGAIDLRNRITGARIMSDGSDPYIYKWEPGEPAIYCDPYNNPHLPVS